MPPPLLTGRDLARSVLVRVVEDGAYANRALSAALDRARALPPEERGLATELVYGVLRRQARLDRALEAVSDRGLGGLDIRVRIALRVAAYQILFLDRIPAYASVSEAVDAQGVCAHRQGSRRSAGVRERHGLAGGQLGHRQVRQPQRKAGGLDDVRQRVARRIGECRLASLRQPP